ncbi:hypothetical protein SBC1_11770 [Caballeronia sp. SBC1]|nr:hypothetical protein SBC2_13180 [Caballeronia sp. SBC2]QIN61191.1 hypothetical protein SBC1_11770 [Caballeronia sp. SBC1]
MNGACDFRSKLVHRISKCSSTTKKDVRKPLFNKQSYDVASHKKMLDIFKNMPRIGSMLRRTNS